MKKLIPFIITILSMLFLHSCFKANDNIGHEGRCTGSAYCSACTSCSRCGHCGSGGTCGVCSGRSLGNSSSKNKTKKHKTSDAYRSKSIKTPKVELNINVNSNNRYLAGTGTVNVYEKPSSQSKIVTTVSKNTKLIQLSKKGPWFKVQVKSSDKKGYVYYKNVK